MAGVNTWNAVSNSLMQGGNIFQQMVDKRLAAQAAAAKAEQDRAEKDQAQRNWAAEYQLRLQELNRKKDEEQAKAEKEKSYRFDKQMDTAYNTFTGPDAGNLHQTGEGVFNAGRSLYDPNEPKAKAAWESKLLWDGINETISEENKFRRGMTSDDLENVMTDYGVSQTPEAQRIIGREYKKESDAAVLAERKRYHDQTIANIRARLNQAKKSGDNKSAEEWQAILDAATADFDAFAQQNPNMMAGMDGVKDKQLQQKNSRVITAQRGLDKASSVAPSPGAGAPVASPGGFAQVKRPQGSLGLTLK